MRSSIRGGGFGEVTKVYLLAFVVTVAFSMSLPGIEILDCSAAHICSPSMQPCRLEGKSSGGNLVTYRHTCLFFPMILHID